jgi:hypothetical protein
MSNCASAVRVGHARPYPAVELRLAQTITTRCLGHWWTAALRFVMGIGHRQTDEIVEAREYRWSSSGWATGPIIGVKISPISGAGPRVVSALEKSARQPTLQAWRLAPRVAGLYPRSLQAYDLRRNDAF